MIGLSRANVAPRTATAATLSRTRRAGFRGARRGIVNLLEGFERAGLDQRRPGCQLAEWMKRRVSNFCAMRADGLVDDDDAAPLTAKEI